jgi:hypothetical protein
LPEDGIAQKLQTLVVSDAAVLVGERSVRQRKPKLLRADRDEKLLGKVAYAGLFGVRLPGVRLRGAGVPSARVSSARLPSAGVVTARHLSLLSGSTAN